MCFIVGVGVRFAAGGLNKFTYIVLLFSFHRALQNNRNELRESLERANATISDVASQLECMKRTVAELKAKEEKLQHLLLEKDKKMSEQQQACDAEIR